jgi:hypothetical protein
LHRRGRAAAAASRVRFGQRVERGQHREQEVGPAAAGRGHRSQLGAPGRLHLEEDHEQDRPADPGPAGPRGRSPAELVRGARQELSLPLALRDAPPLLQLHGLRSLALHRLAPDAAGRRPREAAGARTQSQAGRRARVPRRQVEARARERTERRQTAGLGRAGPQGKASRTLQSL